MGACCSKETGDSASIQTASKQRKQRKRQLLEALTTEAKTDELLSRIPGRICRNGASGSVCIFTQQGRKGTNQDAMVAWENYMTCSDTVFCGVFDGHGPYGHLVARRVRDALPSKLASVWKANVREDRVNHEAQELQASALQMDLMWANSAEFNKATMEDKASHHSQQVGYAGDGELFRSSKEAEMGICAKWKDSFMEAFEATDMDLRRHPSIDCFCSGTTAVTILKQYFFLENDFRCSAGLYLLDFSEFLTL